MSDGPSIKENYRRAASVVHKIFERKNPANLPIEQPTQFELLINNRAATAIGLPIPEKLHAMADEIVE
jgi:putative ABC transport system substrate-binding protein